ncbi:MAG: type II toxin-antitoxin system VapC family toxin [Acidimicrobiales bacterium]
MPDRMRSSSLQGLNVTHAHALASGSLPLLHRDPFDRMLITQAMSERLAIMTSDDAIKQYSIETIPAT